MKIDGVDSSEAVFEIFYDAKRAAVCIRNLELDELVSTVFMRMNPTQIVYLEPNDAFRIGKLEF